MIETLSLLDPEDLSGDLLQPDDDDDEDPGEPAGPPPRALDATDQFDAKDILYMLQVARERRSTPSLAPVDLDVEPEAAPDLAQRRRALGRWVVCAVGAACAILATSAVKLAHPPGAAAAAQPAAEVTPRQARATITRTDSPPASTGDGAGLVRFDTKPGWAWLDGRQLTATSAFVPCGPHQVQIGGQELREVQVPCGGEVVVTR